MINKDHLLETALRECDICVHLHGKLPAGSLDYKPGENQRSTLELLQYLSICGFASAEAMVNGSWQNYESHAKKAEQLSADDFPAAMEEQKNKLKSLFAEITNEDLSTKTATVPWGQKLPLGQALIEILVKFLTAYRMQLFLYAKAAGNDELWTPNCWVGMDRDKNAKPAG